MKPGQLDEVVMAALAAWRLHLARMLSLMFASTPQVKEIDYPMRTRIWTKTSEGVIGPHIPFGGKNRPDPDLLDKLA